MRKLLVFLELPEAFEGAIRCAVGSKRVKTNVRKHSWRPWFTDDDLKTARRVMWKEMQDLGYSLPDVSAESFYLSSSAKK